MQRPHRRFPVRKARSDPFDFERATSRLGGEIIAVTTASRACARSTTCRSRRRRRPPGSGRPQRFGQVHAAARAVRGSTTPAAARCGATTTFPASSTSTRVPARGFGPPQHPAQGPDRGPDHAEIAAAVLRHRRIRRARPLPAPAHASAYCRHGHAPAFAITAPCSPTTSWPWTNDRRGDVNFQRSGRGGMNSVLRVGRHLRDDRSTTTACCGRSPTAAVADAGHAQRPSTEEVLDAYEASAAMSICSKPRA